MHNRRRHARESRVFASRNCSAFRSTLCIADATNRSVEIAAEELRFQRSRHTSSYGTASVRERGIMDLNTITEIARPHHRDGAIEWHDGDAWLAGGTWLFSEQQPKLHRLIDLEGLRWEPLTITEQGLAIAATCKIARLDAVVAPPDWTAAPLIRQCCRSLLASFKIWNTATVGGNICMSLPAGAMISLAVALEGICTTQLRDGSERR